MDISIRAIIMKKDPSFSGNSTLHLRNPAPLKQIDRNVW